MRNTVEGLPIAAGKTATYGGAIGALVSGWSISEIGVVVGIVVGVLGLIFGQYWAWRRDRREAGVGARQPCRGLEIREGQAASCVCAL